MNAATLLDHLASKGYLNDRSPDVASCIETKQCLQDPISLKVFGVLAAILAAVLFTQIGLWISHGNDTSELLFGTAYLILAPKLLLLGKSSQFWTRFFWVQTSIGFMISSKFLFYHGFDFLTDSTWRLPAILLVFGVLTYKAFDQGLDRFFVIWMFFLTTLTSLSDRSYWYNITLFNLIFAALILGIAWILSNPQRRGRHGAAMYGLFASLLTFLWFHAEVGMMGDYFRGRTIIHAWFLKTSLILAFFATVIWITGNEKAIKNPPLNLACIAFVLLCVFSLPFISFSILVFVLGYGKNEKGMIRIMAASLPLLIFLYYENSFLPPSEKFIALFSSGLFFLLGGTYLHYRERHGRART